MDNTTLLYIGYILLVILIAEFIYWRRYLPNMRRLAENNYQDL
jgi:hypothetical protein